jgi:hypothetical protein
VAPGTITGLDWTGPVQSSPVQSNQVQSSPVRGRMLLVRGRIIVDKKKDQLEPAGTFCLISDTESRARYRAIAVGSTFLDSVYKMRIPPPEHAGVDHIHMLWKQKFPEHVETNRHRRACSACSPMASSRAPEAPGEAIAKALGKPSCILWLSLRIASSGAYPRCDNFRPYVVILLHV